MQPHGAAPRLWARLVRSLGLSVWLSLGSLLGDTTLGSVCAQDQPGPPQVWSVSDARLRQAVTTAFQPSTPPADTEAAISAFDLYKDRPWLEEVLQPYVTAQAVHILLNADVFAKLHRGWTLRAVTMAVPYAPDWTVRAFKTLAAIDLPWAKSLVSLATVAAPGVVLPHADILVAVDARWAEGPIREAARAYPAEAMRAVGAYSATPWGAHVFAEAVLADPRWVMTLLAATTDSHPTLRRALASATDPAVQVVWQLVQSAYPDEVKVRMAAFAPALATQTLSLEEAAQRSAEPTTYLRTLMAMHLREEAPTARAVEQALREEVSLLVEEMNQLFEQPPAVRFRALTGLAARELYLLLSYGEAEMFTSSYRGVYERLLASMRQEGVTGDALLAQVHYTRFRVFMKAAAVFHRLESFLATIPSPVARWSLLVRCISDIERGREMLEQGMMVAELLSAPLDTPSLHLMRDTLRSEYERTLLHQQPEARLLYGLLAALLARRPEPGLADAAFMAIATPYIPLVPNLEQIPLAALFPRGVNIQHHFFYNDDDGRQSFHSFLAQYHDDPAWQLTHHGAYVHLSTPRATRTIEIYANVFSEEEQGLIDITQALRTRQITPQIVVHRGHTFYTTRTLAHTPAAAALVIMGNCGGTTLLDAVLSRAPQAHILTTKGIGSLTVNDPLLKALNTYLLSDQVMTWPRFWHQATALLSHNPRFVDYVPPDKNAGAVLLTAYRRARTAQERMALRPRTQR